MSSLALLHQLRHKLPHDVRRDSRTAFVQYRLHGVQGGPLGILVEFADGDFLSPDLRLLHGHHPVLGIVRRIVFKALDGRLEPRIRVVVV